MIAARKIQNVSILILAILVTGVVGTSSAAPQYDSALAAYIKKEKFNLELYELSFCIQEVLTIIESDSAYREIFEKRVARAFDKKLSEAQIYFHTLEFRFFSKQVLTVENATKLYPKSILLIDKLMPINEPYLFKKFSVPFQNYIEYPEQVDDACIVTLISDLPKSFWGEIQSDELAMYRFNSWLGFGFEEFRYYPGTKSSIKSTLNNRIIEFITKKNMESTEPLIVKSLERINSVVTKYKKKQKE